MDDGQFRAQVLAALAPIGVRGRAMFGGLGLYAGDKFFGIIVDGRLYLRTDTESRTQYLERGMPPLESKRRPRGPRTVDRNFEVPAEVISDSALLLEWAMRAVVA